MGQSESHLVVLQFVCANKTAATWSNSSVRKVSLAPMDSPTSHRLKLFQSQKENVQESHQKPPGDGWKSLERERESVELQKCHLDMDRGKSLWWSKTRNTFWPWAQHWAPIGYMYIYFNTSSPKLFCWKCKNFLPHSFILQLHSLK